MALDDPDFAQRVYRVALEGERTRGDGGAILINREKETIAYVLLHEVPNDELREVIGDMLTDEGRRYFFVLEESERNVHIWKMDKASGKRT